MKMASEGRNM